VIRPADLIGAWRLQGFVIRFSDDRPPLYPFGEEARGVIVYSADGTMSAVLSRADRPPLAQRLETAGKAPLAARAAAFDSYLSYAGRWTLDGETVTHHVDLALVPDAVGARQQRRAVLDGDRLTLSYAITARSGIVRRYTLDWRRSR